MRQLLYVSNTKRNFGRDTLDEILAVSRRNNAAVGVTGMLLHMDGAFLQVLEGDAEPVGRTYDRICRDARHWDTSVLLDQTATARAFGQWTMGLQEIGAGDIAPADAFRISREAVAAQLVPGAPLEIATLLRTFEQVHNGQTFSPLPCG